MEKNRQQTEHDRNTNMHICVKINKQFNNQTNMSARASRKQGKWRVVRGWYTVGGGDC